MLLKSSRFIVSCLLLLTYPLFVMAGHEEEHEVDTTSGEFWGQILAIIFLVIISGIIAGLTLGLMSLDTTNLAILEIAGTPQQKYYASRIIPIRKNGHILLSTLLLTNTVLNETLPILFDGIFSKGFISVIVSTALLVLFSEIIPQAIFSKHGLAIGATFALPVRILIACWFVISWPISKLLDYLLGTHTGFTYDVAEFSALVELHDASKYARGTLEPKTVNVLKNVLGMQGKIAADIGTSSSNMLMLEPNTMLTSLLVTQYTNSGYTHIFVYEQASSDKEDCKILGVLDIKSLNLFGEFTEPVGRMKLQTYLTVPSREPIISVMRSLSENESEDKVVLVYRTEQDVQLTKEEQANLASESASAEEKALSKHKNTFRCKLRKIFGLDCQICLRQSSKQFDIAEEGSISSNPTTIDVELESGLLGMITMNDIIQQLVSISSNKITDNQQPSEKVNITKQSAIVGVNVVSV